MPKGSRGGKRGSSGGVVGGEGVPNEATEYYVSGEGMWINNYLRGRGDFGELSESEREYLKDLDRATNGTLADGTLYRIVDASAVFGDMTATEYENLVSRLVYGDNSRLVQASTDKFLNQSGKTVTEKGFMSTTKDAAVAEEWGGFSGSDKPVVLEIKTKGTKGVDLSRYDKNVSADQAQREVLLGRGQSYKIDNITARNGNVYVQVTMQKR